MKNTMYTLNCRDIKYFCDFINKRYDLNLEYNFFLKNFPNLNLWFVIEHSRKNNKYIYCVDENICTVSCNSNFKECVKLKYIRHNCGKLIYYNTRKNKLKRIIEL